jgi:hypothetical protein
MTAITSKKIGLPMSMNSLRMVSSANSLVPGVMPSTAGKVPTTSQQVKCLFWDCASGVFNKKAFNEKYINDFKPVLFFVSECEIKPDQMIEIMGISSYSLDVASTLQSQGKGRLLAYVKNGSVSNVKNHSRARSMT